MADMFRSRILPIGGQGAKDNTVVCMDAWEACTSKIHVSKCSMRCLLELQDEGCFEI